MTRRPLKFLLAISLLLLAAVPTPRPAPTRTPLTSSRFVFDPDWQQKQAQTKRDVQRWHDTQLWNDTIAWNEAAKQKPQEGNGRAMSDQAERQGVSYEDDRFDRLANCESSMRQDAVGGGGAFLSYFQWMLSTFHAAGGVGDPRNVDYATQKALAMHWATVSNPASQWPRCWPKSA